MVNNFGRLFWGVTDFNSYSLIALVVVFFFVLRDLSTRKLDISIPSP